MIEIIIFLATILTFFIFLFRISIFLGLAVITLCFSLGVLLTDREENNNKKKLLKMIESELPCILCLPKEEILYDFGNKSSKHLSLKEFRIFTSKGEYILNFTESIIHGVSKPFQLIKTSEVNFLKEMNFQ